MNQMLDCLGLPTDDNWESAFADNVQLEMAGAVSITQTPPVLDVDCTHCLAVVINTWATFAQRRFTIVIRRGCTSPGATHFSVADGQANVAVSGDLIASLKVELSAASNATPPDIGINVWRVVVPPPAN